jgi:hypothetical protein
MPLETTHRPRTFLETWPRLTKAALLLISAGFCGGLFLAGDRLYSALMARKHPAQETETCAVLDPVRTHALKPNCVGQRRWGRETFAFVTNSLGFRDQRVREVPLSDPRPRIVLLGDSFTQGESSWETTYAGMLTARFPQYEILNGGVSSYSPSNYLNVVRTLLDKHVEFDDVYVFIDMSDTQDEAAYYHDIDASGAVGKPVRESWTHTVTRYHKVRTTIERDYLLTNFLMALGERTMVSLGGYYLNTDLGGNVFDLDRSAWTYRKVSDTEPYNDGYAPLGLEGGIAKEKAKMTLLWQALAAHHIALNVVVYPWPAQVVHDTADSRQVRIWRDWCAGRCQDFISLFPAFLAEKARCPWYERGCWYTKDFVFGDFHYTAAGNVFVADAVAKSIEAAPVRKSYSSSGGT